MRSRSFHQAMLQLAAIAALLMAIMPTLLRLGGNEHLHGSQAVAAHAMTSMHLHEGGVAAHGGHPPVSHDGDDCAYCPLLASLAVLAFVLLVLPALRLPRWNASPQTVAPHRGRRYPCGLGSRGPPMAA